MQEAKLPIEMPENFIFGLKDITYSPEAPRMNDPFTVKGTVTLFTISFLAPIWVIVTIEYPETWWEEIIPIIGAPRARESSVVFGGTFEIEFPKGFIREGDFNLIVGVYAGPTMLVDNWTLPPFPPVAYEETVFTVSGQAPPPEEVWELVEEVLGIVVEAAPPVAAWIMVEEVSGIVVEAAPPVAVWLLVEEVPGIVVDAAPPVAVWIMVEEVPGIVVLVKTITFAPPEVEILDARDITHDSATLRGRLIDTGYSNVSYCYFEWGKTTAYGSKTPEIRMDGGDIGQEFYAELLHYLDPNTTYHFRAVGRSGKPEAGFGYSDDATFRTEAEVVKGFTMSVRNAPAPADMWIAGCVAGGNLPYMDSLRFLNETWSWNKLCPDTPQDFFINCCYRQNPPSPTPCITVRSYRFDFRLRDGKNYVFDFNTGEMLEK